MRSRIAAAIIASAIVAVMAPIGARADHCTNPDVSSVIIFSGYMAPQPVGQNSVNTNAAACIADSDHTTPYDGRWINPGSNGISIRYIIGANLGAISAQINGLGFKNVVVPLTRNAGGTAYNSAAQALDASATGCITAEILLYPDSPEQNPRSTYRTVPTGASSCT